MFVKIRTLIAVAVVLVTAVAVFAMDNGIALAGGRFSGID